MSLDLEAALREFLASAPQTKYAIQQVSISHSAMTQAYHLWTEPFAGTVSDELGAPLTVSGANNIAIKTPGSPDHLDQSFEITLSTVDSSNTFRDEMALIPLDTTEQILVVYREYLSDDLTEPMATVQLQVETIAYNRGAAVITAVSPRLNLTRTGELYTLKRFPTLRGLL
ncbi:MAG: hypothetical protein WA154_11195 [Moraxellaceae bacterium]